MPFVKPRITVVGAVFRAGVAALMLGACCGVLAQTVGSDVPLEGATTQQVPAAPDTTEPSAQPLIDAAEVPAQPATSLAPAAAPEPPPETCRTVTDKAMAADLKALTAQAQKQDVVALVQLHSLSAGFWTTAVELCEGRAKERAQRNLTESQKANALLSEQLGDGPECGAAHKDAATLQDMARAALAERRWLDAATLFHKSEDMWDLATERCSGTQKELANKRQEQAELDGFNAEFCAPLFDRAREQTQKLRASSAGLSREEKQDGLMVAETLWRDALAQCKGSAAQDSARNNAQALARERGTPWVARNPSPVPAASTASRVAAPAAKPVAAAAAAPTPAAAPATPAKPAAAVAVKPVEPAVPPKTTALAIASTPVTVPSLAVAAIPAPAIAVQPVEPPLPQAQPEEFIVGDMHFKGKFVRDVDALTFSGKGKLSWANGDTFEGTLQNGKRHGKGLFIWANGQRYHGDWVNDSSTGQATVDFTNGDHYEGATVNGTPIGLGSMRFASGDTYKGSFLAGKPNGAGVYIWKNGQQFEGDWKSGKPNGQGKLRFANGDSYEGTVSDGMPDQSGRFTWASGDTYTGQWKAGLKEGQGTFTWTSGDRWEGVYEKDQQTSNGTLVRKNP